MGNKAIACLGAIVACATALAGIPATAMADDSAGLTPQYTYNSQNDNGMTFEKVSHADQGLSQADGVVDYTGDGTIAPYTAGLSTTGNGDRGQSYSYAAASSGDWVYIGTMYGGLGVQAILNRDMTSLGLTSKQATALIQTMYAGNMYLGEPDGKSAGGMLFKFNVKTGKTKYPHVQEHRHRRRQGRDPDLPQRLQDERQAVLRGHGHGHQRQGSHPAGDPDRHGLSKRIPVHLRSRPGQQRQAHQGV